MRFTLIYDGPLPSNGSAAKKAEIRAVFRPQLSSLWQLTPLSGQRKSLALEPEAHVGPSVLRDVAGVLYAPVVCDLFKLVAELDILLLRQQRPGSLITQGGDIDNQLKTLFDALRTPGNAQEIGDPTAQGTEDDPFFTLLEDDRLVTRVNVESDRLLGAADPDHVRAVIRVTTRRWLATWGNADLGT
jgi:hypothetical protein